MSVRVSWSRREAFGAWVRLDDATLIAVDSDLADRLGVPSRDHQRERGPLELHIAVTSRCPAPCEGCYMDARPDGEDPPLEALFARLEDASRYGVSTVAFGGGEPLVRSDLPALAAKARALGLVPVMTTSGLGLTPERAAKLVDFAQINVSHDGADGGYRDVRGWDGETIAERAIAILREAKIAVGVNIALTRSTFEHIFPTAERAATLGAREIQLLRYKPGGRAADPSYLERRLSPGQIERLWPMIQRLVESELLGVRIDCAMVPILSASLLAISSNAAQWLGRLGVFGCEAGRHLGGMRIDGALMPCSFFSAPAVGSSNHSAARRSLPLFKEELGEPLKQIRDYHATLAEPCASCELASVCRGGCQVVALYSSGGVLGPDPECPRVLGFRAKSRAESNKAGG